MVLDGDSPTILIFHFEIVISSEYVPEETRMRSAGIATAKAQPIVSFAVAGESPLLASEPDFET